MSTNSSAALTISPSYSEEELIALGKRTASEGANEFLSNRHQAQEDEVIAWAFDIGFASGLRYGLLTKGEEITEENPLVSFLLAKVDEIMEEARVLLMEGPQESAE
ncbi:hypothetical protein [Oecophyllibacter saccharovorans]|uniref:hypothetical protein n=1 Tax=Oecophyllibacter saccharovorans TaxID=2558360 RepID=UPI001171E114|nr:hypothetical protein [Oecophyllibacter saccharovorans]TPW34662.1 hypothetical protein E3203_03685 [Oecophyllibacter saccharovorans]